MIESYTFKADERNGELSSRGTSKSGFSGAPLAAPLGSSNKTESQSVSEQMFDVVLDYEWTNSPTSARKNIPYVLLKEYQVNMSSVITGLLYTAFATYEGTKGLSSSIYDLFSNLDEKLKEGVEKTSEDLKQAYDLNSEDISDKMSTGDQAYKGLYSGVPTGFLYKFPYLQELNYSLSNKWKSGVNFKNKVVSTISDIVENIYTATEIGSHLELPKSFDAEGSESASYKVSFPLLNTVSYDQIKSNWELCHLLVYQNLPNRRSRLLLDPPCIYEVEIPGVRYSPASFVETVTINNYGNTRIMNFDGEDRVIPDIFLVEITLKDLLTPTKNLYQYARESAKKVTVISNDRETITDTTASFLRNVTDLSNS